MFIADELHFQVTLPINELGMVKINWSVVNFTLSRCNTQ